MNTFLILFSSLVLSFFNPPTKADLAPNPQAVSTYYLIRHAEKNSSEMAGDPELTEKGRQRAENWAKIFMDVDFDAVYSTDFKRTRQTAAPTAKLKGLEVKIYDPRSLYDVNFQKETKGKTVLVVGHSNTTPQFANAILNKPKYQNIDESENGALFIVEVFEDGNTTSKVLYIN